MEKITIQQYNDAVSLIRSYHNQIADEIQQIVNKQNLFIDLSSDDKNFTQVEMNVNQLLEKICTITNITKEQLIKKGSGAREKKYVWIRHIYFYLARKITDKDGVFLSYKAIGDLIDRDHTTVMYGIKQVDNLLFKDKKFIAFFSNIRNNIICDIESKL